MKLASEAVMGALGAVPRVAPERSNRPWEAIAVVAAALRVTASLAFMEKTSSR